VFLRYRTATRYDARHDLRGPLLAVLDALQRIVGAHLRLTTVGMRALAAEGLVELRGRGRGAHYVPGPRLRPPGRRRGK
jgi:hypothetical protein